MAKFRSNKPKLKTESMKPDPVKLESVKPPIAKPEIVKTESVKATSGPDPQLSRAKLGTLEDEWMIARVRGDMKFSDRLIDESYQGITSDGLLHSKSDFMQSIAKWAPFHVSAERRESNIQIHGDVAISTGLVTMHGKERASSFRYLRVFRNAEGKWRLIASQSTRFREA